MEDEKPVPLKKNDFNRHPFEDSGGGGGVTPSYIDAYTCAQDLGGALPLIFCIHVRSGPIYWGGLFTLQKRV